MRTPFSSCTDEEGPRQEPRGPQVPRRTLLIVDDELGPRESLRMILEPLHELLMAEDGHRALEILSSTPVDVVTVDLNMPGMKGIDLMREIRRRHPQVEVIIITGCSSVETAVEGIRHGVFDYLTKPFDVAEVGATIQRALERRDSRGRLLEFLRGIGEVLGGDRDPLEAADELSASPELRERLRAALEGPANRPGDDSESSGSILSGELLESLAETIEEGEAFRSGHARRVAFLAGLLAQHLRLPVQTREAVRLAGFLHDIGRIADKHPSGHTAGPVDDREHSGAHAVEGAQLVEPLGLPGAVAEAIRHHHEHWDGSGQPEGRSEKAIPLIARIIAVSDAFDHLTHENAYRPALARGAAIEELKRIAGSELDPGLVKDFVRIAESGASSAGPLLGLSFTPGDDPVETIANATAWIEGER